MTSALDKTGPRALAKKTEGQSDHSSFHLQVLKTTAGAGVGALLVQLGALVFGLETALPVLAIGVATGGLAAAAYEAKARWKAFFGAGMGLVGSALFVAASSWPPFAAALLGAAAVPVLAAGESRRRQVATGVLATVTSAAGLYVANVMLSWDVFAGVVPGPLGVAATGALAGFFLGLASAPKFLAQPRDPVEAAFEEALHKKDGELHDILARAQEIHRTVKGELAARAGDPTMAAIDSRAAQMMLRILQIADQVRRLESDLAATPAFELEDRIGQLKKKAEAAADVGAQETYLSAVASLEQQREALLAVERGRDRVVARLHANVALLEKVRFSLLHLRSADAERAFGESSPVAQALEELGREIDATSTAIGEVYGSEAKKPLPDNVVRLSDGRSSGVLDQRQVTEVDGTNP